MSKLFSQQFAAILCASLISVVAPASSVTTENVTAHLLLEHDSVAPGSTTHALLKIDIRDGWHTYWRNPGDSGEATRIEWNETELATPGDIQWPAPYAIPFGGFVNYGYEGIADHLIPIEISEDVRAGNTVVLDAKATWLVCEEICIPETGEFKIEVPVVNASERSPSDQHRADFKRARSLIPDNTLSLSASISDGQVKLDASTLTLAGTPRFFAHDWGMVEPAGEQTLAGDTLVMKSGGVTPSSDFGGVLVDQRADGSRQAWTVTANLSAAVGTSSTLAAQGDADPIGLATAFVFALLGGLILNLMPCVFPVLSMKALHLIHADGDAGTRRREGVAYTIGVLVFFALLGGALLALRQSGAAIGWGFQLQSPPIVGALALIMVLIGFNLLGLFEIGTRLMGTGQSLAARDGTAGAFFTGALAAVVATPCTAPFMGAALGFALTQSAPVALGVLLTLGLGLAAPFLLIALVPALGRALPRPGAWMETLRQFLAFPMFAAAVWLAWVLALQAGADGVLRWLAALVLAGFVVWLLRLRSGKALRMATAVVAGLACVVLVSTLRTASSPLAVADEQVFSAERLAAARAAGKTVFVNQTAAWCLTCLVNEKNVLSTERVERALAAPNVTYMSGDWTRRDAAITEFLTEHGRSGVPLYVVYRGESPGQVLPAVLTESIVLDALGVN